MKVLQGRTALQCDYPSLADIIDCNACIVISKDVSLVILCVTKTNTDRVEQFFQIKIFPDIYIQGGQHDLW